VGMVLRLGIWVGNKVSKRTTFVIWRYYAWKYNVRGLHINRV
jgi:hypothetical protein